MNYFIFSTLVVGIVLCIQLFTPWLLACGVSFTHYYSHSPLTLSRCMGSASSEPKESLSMPSTFKFQSCIFLYPS